MSANNEPAKPNNRDSMGLLPPVPDTPPPELPSPSDELGIDLPEEEEKDTNIRNVGENQSDPGTTSRSDTSRLSMLPVPDFDELGIDGMDTIPEE